MDGQNTLPDTEYYFLPNEQDVAIVLHRECHFAGQFSIMIEYYRTKNAGVMDEISLERIEELAVYEEKIGENLASLLLSGTDAERVASAREAYRNLREVYSIKNPKNRFPQLISDLILTEDPHAKKEIEAIAAEKNAIVPTLIELIESEDYYDPLFPGFGLAPSHALTCLQKIGDKRAIIALFESIGKHGFFNEDVAISALKHIGKPAKEFLLKVLNGHPITDDNERAAVALVAFEEDDEVVQACWKILQTLDCKQFLGFAIYLVLTCEGLTNPDDRNDFRKFANTEQLPRQLKTEMANVIHSWK